MVKLKDKKANERLTITKYIGAYLKIGVTENAKPCVHRSPFNDWRTATMVSGVVPAKGPADLNRGRYSGCYPRLNESTALFRAN